MAGGKGSKLLALVLVGVTLGVSGYFVLSEPKVRYALSVDQVWEKTERWLGPDLRLQGVFVPGTLKRRPAGCGFDFALQQEQGSARRIFVHYDGCVLPDTICDLAPTAGGYAESITVDGTLERRGRELHFLASQVMAKCSGKYWYPLDGGPSALCAQRRPGFHCPMCDGLHHGSVR
jgi:cytochrome c-type biogenesis protein CcmE